MRRLLVLLAAWLCLAGAVAAPAPSQPVSASSFEATFEGLAIGRGRLRSRAIGLDRGFLVWTTGRQSKDAFVLDQFFRFDDGMTDRRTWRFRKSGPGTYVGERQDLAAPAKVRVEADGVRLSYDIWLRRRGKPPLKLHCEDRITRLASGALLSRGTIYRLGVPLGSVETHLIPDTRRPTTSGRQP
ncbi:Protein of unknown function [Kaistia soli DSM 19436]|uniref:DUF3833 family protein n=1 Tax=Kaistia soli DSM 19436 TaxID=1122133 RepID=A0A1M5EFA4_9HYPH|nr:DUF3833 family protein [Kaistia soli]SHF77905.1 Protein of unknown function [Kaistia soli DSM 19436]